MLYLLFIPPDEDPTYAELLALLLRAMPSAGNLVFMFLKPLLYLCCHDPCSAVRYHLGPLALRLLLSWEGGDLLSLVKSKAVGEYDDALLQVTASV